MNSVNSCGFFGRVRENGNSHIRLTLFKRAYNCVQKRVVAAVSKTVISENCGIKLSVGCGVLIHF